jgi:hypothetical protein
MASDAMPVLSAPGEFAWIRTRSTGQVWWVTGTVLDRALTYPEDYEILEEGEEGDYLDEEGVVVVKAADHVTSVA